MPALMLDTTVVLGSAGSMVMPGADETSFLVSLMGPEEPKETKAQDGLFMGGLPPIGIATPKLLESKPLENQDFLVEMPTSGGSMIGPTMIEMPAFAVNEQGNGVGMASASPLVVPALSDGTSVPNTPLATPTAGGARPAPVSSAGSPAGAPLPPLDVRVAAAVAAGGNAMAMTIPVTVPAAPTTPGLAMPVIGAAASLPAGAIPTVTIDTIAAYGKPVPVLEVLAPPEEPEPEPTLPAGSEWIPKNNPFIPTTSTSNMVPP